MAYTSDVIRRATARLERQRTAHRSQQRAVRAEIYEAVPALREIDASISAGMQAVAAAAFDYGTDPRERVEQLRQQNLELRRRRRELLIEHGYEPDSLDDKPLCPRCDDRGWNGSTMCTCLSDLCAQEQIASLSSMLDLGEQSFETFSLDWYSRAYDDALGMSPWQNMTGVRQLCENYANRFGKFVIHNLFLSGAPGLGKTFLSAAIARVVSEKGYSVVYDTAVHIFSAFEDAKFGRGEEAEAAVNRALSCDLLILDDLGSELTSPMSQSALYTIVNTRLMGEKHTVISSNLTMEDIRQRYQPMIASRLEGEYRELSFVGEDIRLQRKN
ncbi:MAG: ATP-binding protein [Oscillospiraceae bacterium]|nr:ATP-binding protein [Oscillospiraceae bacterium]